MRTPTAKAAAPAAREPVTPQTDAPMAVEITVCPTGPMPGMLPESATGGHSRLRYMPHFFAVRPRYWFVPLR